MTKKPFNLSNEYWERLTPKNRALYGLINPQPTATYTTDVSLGYLKNFIDDTMRDVVGMGGVFDLEPDFQRGHVWKNEQRVAYVEALIRGTAPNKILFNCPGWIRGTALDGDIPEHTFQCIDGLQRLTSVQKFLDRELNVFKDLSVDDLKGTPFDVNRLRLKFCIFEFTNRADLLKFYLNLNSGGTVHSQVELERVKQLLDDASGVEAVTNHQRKASP